MRVEVTRVVFGRGDAEMTLPEGVYHVEVIGGVAYIHVEVPRDQTSPVGTAEIQTLGVYDYEPVYERPKPRPPRPPCFWKRRCAQPPPFRWSPPDTAPRRTGRRSRDGRWFRGARQNPLVGAS